MPRHPDGRYYAVVEHDSSIRWLKRRQLTGFHAADKFADPGMAVGIKARRCYGVTKQYL